MNFARSAALREKAHRLIPGGCQTYAKGDDQYPEFSPGFISRGKGSHVWDVDGNEFIEYGMGLRAVALGHAFEPVNEAAYRQMQMGHNFVRPSPLEAECAEELLSLIPGAEMVKFGKNGSDATGGAVRLARAFTGRDRIAYCGDHPFFSVEDWFIGTTPMSAGIPKAVSSLSVRFKYNDLASAQAVFDEHPGQIACLILEPEREVPPAPGYLGSLKSLCEKEGAVLIFDEMITGFRWANGGGQAFHGVIPHLSTFGKAMGNGYSISALAGKREIMELGGFGHGRKRVCLLSLTHGAENPNLAAAIEVMRIYRSQPIVETLWRQGERLKRGVERSIEALGLEGRLLVMGRPCCLVFNTRDAQGVPSQAFRALFMQELIRRGVLAPSFIVSYSHRDEDIDQTIEAVHASLEVYKKALEDGVEKYLVGRPLKPVFRPYN